MKLHRFSVSAVALLVYAIAFVAPVGATNYTTFHFDNARDGWNNAESVLYQGVIPRIGEYLNMSVNGAVEAQPLYLSSEYIPSKGGNYSAAFVVTDNDYIYAINPIYGTLWSKSYGNPVPNSYSGGCKETQPTIGIQGTPVIDTSTDTMYLVSYTLVSNYPTYTLHALSPGGTAPLWTGHAA